MLHISNSGLLSLVCSVVFINAEKIKISKICNANFIEPEGIESIKIVPVLNWGQYLIKITMEVVDICWYWKLLILIVATCLEPCQPCEAFFNYFWLHLQNVPSRLLDMVLNTPLYSFYHLFSFSYLSDMHDTEAALQRCS